MEVHEIMHQAVCTCRMDPHLTAKTRIVAHRVIHQAVCSVDPYLTAQKKVCHIKFIINVFVLWILT